MTYNHEAFISDALNGFTLQKTSFPVVYVIIDDASTDKTPEAIRQYVKENFILDHSGLTYDKDTDYGHITFAKHKKNDKCYFATIYLAENHYKKRKSKEPYYSEWANTKYVALCEGDDYWTDPQKIQKQVDFLEVNHDFSICFHPVKVLMQDKGVLVDDFITRDVTDESDIFELAKGNYIHTPSVLYRNDSRVTEWQRTIGPVFVGDYVLHMLNARLGKIKKLPDTMAVYRYGTGVLSSDKSIRPGLELIIALSKLSVVMDDSALVNIIENSLQQQKTALCESVNKQYLVYKRVLCSKSYRFGKCIMKPLSIIKRLIISNKSL